eukprot:Pompholyxophrys_sp_v1_NODE_152_length_1503_cov_156.640193.p2 type:complete len:123 gc:universal NODE_152_length_1503_cov_156.640193:412-44(-)
MNICRACRVTNKYLWMITQNNSPLFSVCIDRTSERMDILTFMTEVIAEARFQGPPTIIQSFDYPFLFFTGGGLGCLQFTFLSSRHIFAARGLQIHKCTRWLNNKSLFFFQPSGAFVYLQSPL